MPSHRLTVAAALLAATLCGSLHAAPVQDTYLSAPAADAVAYTPTLEPLADFATVPALAPAAGVASSPLLLAADDSATADAEAAQDTRTVADLRRALIAMAMQLRDTRYVRGGRDPSPVSTAAASCATCSPMPWACSCRPIPPRSSWPG